MEQSGGRLLLMAVIGFLLVQVAMTGKLGSLLAAMIAPNDLQEETNPLTNNQGAVKGLPTSGKLTPTQIGVYAINAGFGLTGSNTRNSLVIAIAVALAESGGNTQAHNPGGPGDVEDSYGLWQINALAHPSYSKSKLYQPAYNASAAFQISSGGTNWNPWGTYTSGKYLQYMDTAQTAALDAVAQYSGSQGS